MLGHANKSGNGSTGSETANVTYRIAPAHAGQAPSCFPNGPGPAWLGSALGVEVRMTPSGTIRLIVISLVLICTAGCDQVTKHVARAELGQISSGTLRSRFIEFTLSENPGAFLSLGASCPQAVRNALTVCVSFGLAFLLAYLVRTPRLRLASFLGLALIWAGGISNLIDRFLRHGLVTDFVVVRAGPFHTGVFNLADFAILVGVLFLLVSLRAGGHDGEAHRVQKGAST
jgi:signal peptidase II